VKGLANITGEGFLNIIRLDAKVCYEIDHLPKTPEIFLKLQQEGNIPEEEMFKDFNMGIGFVVIIEKNDLEIAENILQSIKTEYCVLGSVKKADQPCIKILQKGLYSEGSFFSTLRGSQ
jgi:phosphoribosylformylglycinamidine cyclo-ligase